MNEENNNIELPKRLDEVPKEPNEEILKEEIINDNNEVNKNIFPVEEIESLESLNIGTPINNDIEDNSVLPDINTITPEELNQNIFDTDLSSPTANNNQDVLTMPEQPTVEVTNTVIPEATLPINETVPNVQPQNTEPLNKKLVVEPKPKKDKEKGNALVGFFALLLILAIILVTLFYFIKLDYIKLPNDIKNKIPFMNETTTTTTPVNQGDNGELENNNNDNLPDNVSVVGEFLEASHDICPDVGTKLILNEDLTFTFNRLNYNADNDACTIDELTGNYTARSGNLELVPNGEQAEVIIGKYKETDVTLEISFEVDEALTIYLYDVNER